jgi:predicted O-linked N-acetylglucosamine transferase (SPINDLY family)
MTILKAVPGSRLVMTQVPEGSVRRFIAERAAMHGVEPQRLVLHAKVSDVEFRRLARQIDVALDPFPYNGTTTTCETLWLGIPVVTLVGHHSVSRSGHALLKAVGLEELAAKDEADYLRIATLLANDRARLARLRAELPRRFAASPLRDERGFTRELEAAYRDMWARWCQARATAGS